MKKKFKKLVILIVKFFNKIFPSKIIGLLNYYIKNQLYTYWMMSNFKATGNSMSIGYPIYLKGGKYISVGEGFTSDQRLRLDAIDEFLGEKFTPQIIIGGGFCIQKDCHIGAINKIIIGDNVLIASRVFISDHFHGEINSEAFKLPPASRKLYSKGPVIIEDNVWIGDGVAILPNVTIGRNSIVGANAVVTKSVPSNCVVGGNPARIIKKID